MRATGEKLFTKKLCFFQLAFVENSIEFIKFDQILDHPQSERAYSLSYKIMQLLQ